MYKKKLNRYTVYPLREVSYIKIESDFTMENKFTPEDLKKAEMLMNEGHGALTDEQLASVVGGQLDTDAIIEELRVIGNGDPDVEAVIQKFHSDGLFAALLMASSIKKTKPELYNKCYECIMSHR